LCWLDWIYSLKFLLMCLMLMLIGLINVSHLCVGFEKGSGWWKRSWHAKWSSHQWKRTL
jgi:hypothetical protein